VATAGLNRHIIIAVALATGAGVAVAGSIGFVGLVVPHLVRPLTGHRPGAAIVPAAIAGAALLLAADIAVRLLPMDLRLGVLTALIGAPFFLSLILRGR
jgi:iron complex transport system permease protein